MQPEVRAKKVLCPEAIAMRARHNASAAAEVRRRLEEQRAQEERVRKRTRRALQSCGLESDDEGEPGEAASGQGGEKARAQVLELVRKALQPFHKAGVLSRAQYKEVAARATAKVLKGLPAAAAAGAGGRRTFLARNGAKVAELVQQYVRLVTRSGRGAA